MVNKNSGDPMKNLIWILSSALLVLTFCIFAFSAGIESQQNIISKRQNKEFVKQNGVFLRNHRQDLCLAEKGQYGTNNTYNSECVKEVFKKDADLLK
jgi:hypothetical protein